MTIGTWSDRTAVVTGGGSGIGRSLCLALAAEGMNIAVVDRDGDRAASVADEVQAIGAGAAAYRCDVSDADAVEHLRDEIVDRFGSVFILCNNAGVVEAGPIESASQEDWNWVFGVNFWGVVNGLRAFVPAMKALGEGHILNTASLNGLFTMPGYGVYSASKYAVVAVSETLRLELAPAGIGVSVLCPGWVRTRIDETTRMRAGFDDLPVGDSAPATDACEPEEAARLAIQGLKSNRPYILTGGSAAARAKSRFDSIMQEFDKFPEILGAGNIK